MTRYLQKHFSGVRLFGTVPDIGDRPVVIAFTHPSWWDPLIGLTLASRFFPGRTHRAVIDNAGLRETPFFEKLGCFGLDKGTPRGLRTLIETGAVILSDSNSVLWVAPQGRFADVREPDVDIEPGLPRLLEILTTPPAIVARQPIVLPLALEYPFWDARLPEALAHFGTPITSPQADWTSALRLGLEATRDRLREASLSRNASRFTTLIGGRTGFGNIYGAWKRLVSRSPADITTPTDTDF